MKNKIFILILIFIFTPVFALAHYPKEPPKIKDLKQFDKELAIRLNLTDEQLKILRKNKAKNIKAMEDTIDKMESVRKKIRNIYIIGIPKYQADIRTAPMKMELVLLKQNADKIREENRKNFESILTPEQKKEFEQFKKELAVQRKPHAPR